MKIWNISKINFKCIHDIQIGDILQKENDKYIVVSKEENKDKLETLIYTDNRKVIFKFTKCFL